MSTEEKSLKDIIREEYIKCARSASYFMKKYCMIQHPTKGKIPFHLYPYQEDSLQEFQENDRCIILKSRQLGISTLIAGYALWMILFQNDKNCLVVAIDQNTSKNLVTKVKVMFDNLPSWLKLKAVESNKLSIRLSNGSQIKAVSSTGTSGRSEALSLVIIDEAAFVDGAEELWASLQQTLSTGGQGILLSTPNGTGNFFHKMWTKAEAGENKFKTLRLPWQVHPERDQTWRDRQDAELGLRLAAQECDCDFSTSGNTVVSPELISYYMQTYVQEPIEKRGFDGNYWVWEFPDYTKNYVLTADVARGDGSDYSAFHVIDVESCRQVAEYKGQVGTKEFGNLLVAAATEWNNALLVIENANIGWAAIQQVIDRNYQNLYYTYKQDALDSDKFLTKGYDLASKTDMVAGFTMSHKTRPLVISKMELYIREKSCIIRSKRLLDELFVFIWKAGRAEAAQGYNDDLVMCFGQGLWVRDTALKLRQAGIEINRAALQHLKSTVSVYKPSTQTNQWKMTDSRGNSEDMDWLL
jgi:Terminase large subunit, T4likevirus-type, N-terminal